MHLKIVTPERVVLDAEVDSVNALAVDGYVGILPKHVPLVTPLAVGLLEYVAGGKAKEQVAVMGGVLSTDGREVTVLCDAAELRGEVDALRAETARKRAEALLAQKQESVDVQRARLALARAMTRMKLAGKK
ncbi:MAG: ATP synthase F1 subunit epsilon [Candidatus Melainabacteria bacterium]